MIGLWLACAGPEAPPFVAEGILNEILSFSPEGDWIELFNPSAETKDLTGWSLVDAATEPYSPWSLPAGAALPPGEFLVVYLDGAPGEMHAPFKLDYQGGDLLLFADDGSLADEGRYAFSAEGVSWARIPDGSEDWGPLLNPTPGASNGEPL